MTSMPFYFWWGDFLVPYSRELRACINQLHDEVKCAPSSAKYVSLFLMISHFIEANIIESCSAPIFHASISYVWSPKRFSWGSRQYRTILFVDKHTLQFLHVYLWVADGEAPNAHIRHATVIYRLQLQEPSLQNSIIKIPAINSY